MKVSREEATAHRERIIDAAAALFRANGFDGIGVADIMKAAELTHGGFYGHFRSKDDLIAQSTQRAAARAKATWEKVVDTAPDAPYPALLRHYLSPRHRDDAARGCTFAALAADTARRGEPVRVVYAEGLQALVDILTRIIPGSSKPVRRRKALAAMAALVGAVSLARAVDDPALSDEILRAAGRELLAAAGR